MARRSFFFLTFTICSILVRGDTSTTTDPALPSIPLLPECQTLLGSLSAGTQQLPFLVGESIWVVGRIYATPSSTTANPTGTNPTGTNPTGTNPTGTNPTGTNPTGTNPTGTNPTGTNPTGTNPTGTNPTGTNPTGTNPTGTNPTGTNPTGTNPTGTNPTGTNPTGTNPTGTNPTGTNPTGTTTGTPDTCPKDNQCSIFSYTDDCDSIKVLVALNEDKSICLKQATFNKKTNSVALFKSVLLPCQLTPYVAQSSFGYFGVVSQDSKMTIAQQTSLEIKELQKTQVVLVAAGEGGEWLLYSTCDKSVVFVLYSEQVVKDCKIEDFNEAINGKLTTLQITAEQLKSINTEIKIDISAFIQPLPPPPAKSGGTALDVSVKNEVDVEATKPEN